MILFVDKENKVRAVKKGVGYKNYLPDGLFENINLWEYNSKKVGLYNGGILMDGTELKEYSANYQTQVKIALTGSEVMRIRATIKTNAKEIADQQILYYYRKCNDGKYWTDWWFIEGDDEGLKIEKEYDTDGNITLKIEVTTEIWKDIDFSYVPRVGFRFIPNTKATITEFEVDGVAIKEPSPDLTPVVVSDDDPMAQMSCARLECLQLSLYNGEITGYTPYVDSRLVDRLDKLSQENEQLTSQLANTNDTLDSILTDIVPELFGEE